MKWNNDNNINRHTHTQAPTQSTQHSTHVGITHFTKLFLLLLDTLKTHIQVVIRMDRDEAYRISFSSIFFSSSAFV